ncbi:MAG TPA: hypothetical protein V6D19_10990, partial [Stenomitos sp.]
PTNLFIVCDFLLLAPIVPDGILNRYLGKPGKLGRCQDLSEDSGMSRIDAKGIISRPLTTYVCTEGTHMR